MISGIDLLLHGGELLFMAVMLLGAVRFWNRVESVLKDYPPHRHVNGSIMYPNDFPPPEMGQMSATAGRHP